MVSSAEFWCKKTLRFRTNSPITFFPHETRSDKIHHRILRKFSFKTVYLVTPPEFFYSLAIFSQLSTGLISHRSVPPIELSCWRKISGHATVIHFLSFLSICLRQSKAPQIGSSKKAKLIHCQTIESLSVLIEHPYWRRMYLDIDLAPLK